VVIRFSQTEAATGCFRFLLWGRLLRVPPWGTPGRRHCKKQMFRARQKSRKEGIQFIRAQNKEEYSSAVFSNGLTTTNTLPQKTPSNGLSSFCLALRSLSSSLLYWLYCDVRSDPAAQLVLSPNLNPDFLNVFLSKLTSQPLPLLSDQCDDPKKDCSILVPILHFSGFRFRLCRVFIRPVHSMICDLILQNIRSCDSSLLIMYSIAENIKL
jgi:hypothetical protein